MVRILPDGLLRALSLIFNWPLGTVIAQLGLPPGKPFATLARMVLYSSMWSSIPAACHVGESASFIPDSLNELAA